MAIANRRLYLADDGRTVVEHGDPRASSLLATEGAEIDDNYLKARGITIPDKPAEGEKPRAKAEKPAEKDDAGPKTAANTPDRVEGDEKPKPHAHPHGKK